MRLRPMAEGDLAALVSVRDSRRFWESAGFACAPGDAAALASYPADAVYMARRL